MRILPSGDGNERSLENISLLDRAGRGRGGLGRVADTGGYGLLQGICGKACPGPSCHCVPHRLGHPVRPDGHRCGPGEPVAKLEGPFNGAESLCGAAGRELFLEFDLLQPPDLRAGPSLAGAAVGADHLDDLRLP